MIKFISLINVLLLVRLWNPFFALHKEIRRKKALDKTNIAFVIVETSGHFLAAHGSRQQLGINLFGIKQDKANQNKKHKPFSHKIRSMQPATTSF